MSAFRSLARQLGLPPLDFDLDEHQRGRIMRASVIPAIVLIAQIVLLLPEVKYDRFDLIGITGSTAPETWQRIYQFASDIQIVEILSLATLFLAGIYRWGRSEGTWLLLIGVILTTVGFAIAVGVVMIRLASVDQVAHFPQRIAWFSLAYACGLLAVGYFFLAYRGLSSQPSSRRRRRIRRRQPPPSIAPLED